MSLILTPPTPSHMVARRAPTPQGAKNVGGMPLAVYQRVVDAGNAHAGCAGTRTCARFVKLHGAAAAVPVKTRKRKPTTSLPRRVKKMARKSIPTMPAQPAQRAPAMPAPAPVPAPAMPAPVPARRAVFEVAVCSPSFVGTWHGEWEACFMLRRHGTVCDVKIESDGDICRNVPSRFVRRIGTESTSDTDTETDEEEATREEIMAFHTFTPAHIAAINATDSDTESDEEATREEIMAFHQFTPARIAAINDSGSDTESDPTWETFQAFDSIEIINPFEDVADADMDMLIDNLVVPVPAVVPAVPAAVPVVPAVSTCIGAEVAARVRGLTARRAREAAKARKAALRATMFESSPTWQSAQ